MPLGVYERQRVISLYRNLERTSNTELVEILKSEGIVTTR